MKDRFLTGIKKLNKIDVIAMIFIILMGVYYAFRMFNITPWYDELYTYYYFISRGPIYSAIHWPVPNNHVGFSVLSACLNIFGNSAISLRGISFISAIGTLIVIYILSKNLFPDKLSLAPLFLYSCMNMVNNLATQGRGYSLSSFCFALSVLMLFKINEKKATGRHYIIFALCLIWSLYAVPSNIYFVIPLCLAGGTILLHNKNYVELKKLILTSVVSAVVTVLLYAIIWLAIGSNLLTKDESYALSGQSHVSIILHAPFTALKTGLEYMLSSPYIQSVEREGYFVRFWDYIKSLFGQFFPDYAMILLVLVIISIVVMAISLSLKVRKDFQIFMLLVMLMMPVMLIVQCALPYYRVFNFYGILISFSVIWLFYKLRVTDYLTVAVSFLFFVLCLLENGLMNEYSEREALICDAFKHADIQAGSKVCVTDVDEEYLYKYLYDRETSFIDPTTADYVIIDKNIVNNVTDEQDGWKWYIYPDSEETEVIKNMNTVYENDRFVLLNNSGKDIK